MSSFVVQAVHVSGVPETTASSPTSSGSESGHGKREHEHERKTDTDHPAAKSAQHSRSTRKDQDAELPHLQNGLPPGWQKGYDSLHRIYYYNSYLGESSWTPPPGSHLHAKHQSAHKRAHASSGGDQRRRHRGRHASEGAGDSEDAEKRSSSSAHSSSSGGDGEIKGQAGDKGKYNKSKYDFTGRAARKDFLSFLGSMVTSAVMNSQKSIEI
jgi:hypothetical protein